jgi:hypothetical protein
VWVRDGCEAVVHLDSLSVTIQRGVVRVSVDLSTDETGRGGQEVVFRLAASDEPGDLRVVTDRLQRGDAALAARWGAVLQDAVWASVLDVGDGALLIAAAGGRAADAFPEGATDGAA